MVRVHEDPNVVHPEGRVDPLADIETIETELIYADLEQAAAPRAGRARGQLHDPGDAHAHDDHRPSCSVNLESGAFHCWGCDAKGGAYDAAVEIDPDAFAADHQAHAGVPATNATATLLRSYVEPHLAAAGALAATTRARCSSHPIRRGPRHDGTFRTGSSGSDGRSVFASTPPPDGTATQPDPGRPSTSSPRPG